MDGKSKGYIYYDYHKKTEKEELIEIAWKSVFNWLTAIVIILAVLTLVWSVFFRVVEVDGDSMLPTLQDGDKIVVYTFNYTPEPGDIIVANADNDTTLVKRVIATQNQNVNIDYNNSSVYIDSQCIDESYILDADFSFHDDEIEYPHSVPEGHLFLMGDNRNSSKDSRSSVIGDVDADSVIGKVVFRISSDYKVY